MPRESQPRYWPQRRMWYAMIGGKRHPLVRLRKGEKPTKAHEAEAWRAFAALTDRLKARGDLPLGPGDTPTVATLCSRFLAARGPELAEATRQLYRSVCTRLAGSLGGEAAEDVTPAMLEKFLGSQGWARSTQHNRVVVLRAIWSWGVSSGLVAGSPAARMARPAAPAREAVTSPEEAKVLLAAETVPWMRDLIAIVYHTGCRQSEAYNVAAEDVQFDPSGRAGLWRIAGKTTRKTGRLRVVYFGDAVARILRRRMRERKSGRLFVTAKGTPITNAHVSRHLAKIRAANGLGGHVTVTGMRHTFATDAIARGVPAETVAALLGHADSTMVSRQYARLHDRPEHLREQLRKVRGDGD